MIRVADDRNRRTIRELPNLDGRGSGIVNTIVDYDTLVIKDRLRARILRQKILSVVAALESNGA